MDIVYFLLPVALGLAAFGVLVFFLALRNGQFDDLEGPRWRVLYEDDERAQPTRVQTVATSRAGTNGALHTEGEVGS